MFDFQPTPDDFDPREHIPPQVLSEIEEVRERDGDDRVILRFAWNCNQAIGTAQVLDAQLTLANHRVAATEAALKQAEQRIKELENLYLEDVPDQSS